MGREPGQRFQIHGRLTFPIGLRQADPDMSYPTRGMTEDRSSPWTGGFRVNQIVAARASCWAQSTILPLSQAWLPSAHAVRMTRTG